MSGKTALQRRAWTGTLACPDSCRTVMGMSKTERIEVRVSADDKHAIAAAAAMEHTTTTEFVRVAVLEARGDAPRGGTGSFGAITNA